jgi:hypothetical protein
MTQAQLWFAGMAMSVPGKLFVYLQWKPAMIVTCVLKAVIFASSPQDLLAAAVNVSWLRRMRSSILIDV